MHQRNSSFHLSITFSLQSKYTLQDTIYQRNFSPYKALYIYIYVREVAPSTSQLLSHFSLNTGYSVYQRNFSFFFRSSYFSSLLSSHIYIYMHQRNSSFELSITSSLQLNTLYRTPYTYMNQRNFIFFGCFLESIGRWSLSSLPDKLEQAFYALRG